MAVRGGGEGEGKFHHQWRVEGRGVNSPMSTGEGLKILLVGEFLPGDGT